MRTTSPVFSDPLIRGENLECKLRQAHERHSEQNGHLPKWWGSEEELHGHLGWKLFLYPARDFTMPRTSTIKELSHLLTSLV